MFGLLSVAESIQHHYRRLPWVRRKDHAAADRWFAESKARRRAAIDEMVGRAR